MNISPKFGLKTLVTIGSSKPRKLQQQHRRHDGLCLGWDK
jgi:hypothetical protein